MFLTLTFDVLSFKWMAPIVVILIKRLYHLWGPSNLCCIDATTEDFPRPVLVLPAVVVLRNLEEGVELPPVVKLELNVDFVSLVGGFEKVEEEVEKDEEVVDEGHFLVSVDLLSPENEEPEASVGRL